MAVYEVERYRNIALVGHTGSGKTTLAEALLFKTGVTNRLGSVTDRTSILDASDEEKERQSSLESALCHFDHGRIHANVIDTPGTAAFCGQAIAALAAVECAAVVVSAASGIQVNTRKMVERARAYGLGVWLVVNHIDAANADLAALVGQLRETFGAACVPVNLPTGGGSGVIDCFSNESGDADFSNVADAHTAVIEAIVGADDDLMEKYLGGELGASEAAGAAAKAVAAGELVPILFTDARNDVGITAFLDALEPLCPSPVTGKRRALVDGDETTVVEPHQAAPFVAQVFRIVSDAKSHIKYLSVRVHAGKLTTDMMIKTAAQPKGVRPGQIMRTLGPDHADLEAAVAGDIVTLAKLDLQIGEGLYTDAGGTITMPKFPTPMFSKALTSKARGDEDKIINALKRFSEEDPCFRCERSASNELLIHGMGDAQLRTYIDQMTRQYKVSVETHPPKVPYKETITVDVRDVAYTHKKQTGGAGQYGKVIINLVAAQRGEGYEFVDKIFGGAIDQSFRPSVDKGVRAQMAEGVLAGYPVEDVKVELIDGKTHPVDSKDIAFQIAGRGAFKEAFMKAKPVLLEPIVTIEVTCPTDTVGDIQGDLASRRGRPQGQDMLPGNVAVIKAQVPLAEVSDYNSRLSSITAGEGSFSLELSHYEPVPSNVQQQIIEAARKSGAAAGG